MRVVCQNSCSYEISLAGRPAARAGWRWPAWTVLAKVTVLVGWIAIAVRTVYAVTVCPLRSMAQGSGGRREAFPGCPDRPALLQKDTVLRGSLPCACMAGSARGADAGQEHR
jgi:hypothetical protein